ncbi:MAG: PEP-CTERM sorting domain-containing protein [Candidatus Rokuibacteriota bacterium]
MVALIVAMMAGVAEAVPFSFTCITNNNATDCATGEAQLSVDVTDPAGDNNVLFTFSNSGPLASSITDVYFDDGTLLDLAQVLNGSGVSFSEGASPPDLPGGNNVTPPFTVTVGFLADSDPPAQPNGVNPGETLGILFTLQSGQEFQSVLDDLADGSLRIGIHVQGFIGGGSEAFVNDGGNGQVPAPATLVLLGLGLIGAATTGAIRTKR